VQQASAAASLPEDLVSELAALCKQLVLHSASLGSSEAATAVAADSSADQEQQQQSAAMHRAVNGTSDAAAAAEATADASWSWLGPELQLMLESRVLGQSLPARRLLDMAAHAGIGTDMDAVEPDAWLRRGRQLLADDASIECPK
jgi:hypothetical protein